MPGSHYSWAAGCRSVFRVLVLLHSLVRWFGGRFGADPRCSAGWLVVGLSRGSRFCVRFGGLWPVRSGAVLIGSRLLVSRIELSADIEVYASGFSISISDVVATAKLQLWKA